MHSFKSPERRPIMPRQNIEEMLERKVRKLSEEERAKHEELSQIQKELRRYENTLESLKKEIAPRKRRGKEVNVAAN
jgi:predicted RNase H-like nuclease (RuvC/YqgF family)